MIVAHSDLNVKLIEEFIIEIVIFVLTAVHSEKWIISLFSFLFG
jgi:hypothetical protein